MSEHLPECYWPELPERAICICDRLRACEQRALEAAREAIAELHTYDDHGALKPFKPESAVVYMTEALAAIDALMVGRSGNPGTPPSAEEGEQA